MTLAEIREAVDAIREETDDPETAHVMEAQLRAGVLQAIADGVYGLSAPIAAREALKTIDIQFPRWFA